MSDIPAIHDIPVVILCGGKGMRIREVSELLPKPMLRIGNKPILWHVMKIYAHHGFRRFVLCLGYKGDQIKDYFMHYHVTSSDITLDFRADTPVPDVTYHADDSEPLDWQVTLADTGLNTLTGGRVARATKHIDQNIFMLTYGDGVGDINISDALGQHASGGAMITITGVRPPSRFGKLAIEQDRIVQFEEKPQSEGGYISGGFMIVNTGFVGRYLTEDEDCVLEKDGLPRAARDGGLMVYRHDGFWMPMDNHSEYNRINEMWAKGEAPWKVW